MRRHPIRLASLVTALVLGLAPRANAQVCQGHASFAAGDLRMSGNLGFSSDTKIAGAAFTFGEPTGLFGGPSFDYVSYPSPSDKALIYTGTVGYGIDLADRGTVALCPLLVGSFQDGPTGLSINRRVDVTAKTLGVGASIGTDIPLAPRTHLVPFFQAVLTTSSSQTIIHDILDITTNGTGNYVAITLGVGVVVDKVWTIRPSFYFPAGRTGGPSTFGITFSINAGNGPSN